MRIKSILALLSGFILSAGSLSSGQSPVNPERPILMIGLDGFAANIARDHISKFPNIEKLMKNGSYSFESRTVLPSSSAANWSSMFTGSPPELHGFTMATSKAPEVKPRLIGEFGLYPGIFGLMKQQRKNDVTGCFYQWEGLKHVLEEKAITKTFVGEGDALEKAARDFISSKKPSLMFVIFDEPDHTGHASGWGGPQYIEMCKKLDSHVGNLVNTAITAYKGRDPIIIVVSDHGGIKKGHGGKTMEEMNHILFFCGKGIKRGYEMKDSHMIYDIGATLAWMKGLKTPQSWIGRPHTEIME